MRPRPLRPRDYVGAAAVLVVVVTVVVWSVRRDLAATPCSHDVCDTRKIISGYTHSDYSACVCEDVAYGTHPQQRLDVYKPPGKGPFPVIVWVHGGHFTTGSRVFDVSGDGKIDVVEDWAAVLRQVTRNYAVVSIDYRLASSTAHYTRLIQDVRQAVRFVKWQGPRFRFKAAGSPGPRVALWGHSAGATLVTLTDVASRLSKTNCDFGQGFAELAKYDDESDLVIAYSGVYDFNQVLDPYRNSKNPLHELFWNASNGASHFLGCDHYNGDALPYAACKPPTAQDPPPYPALPNDSPLRLASPLTWAGLGSYTMVAYGTDDALLPPAVQSKKYWERRNAASDKKTDFFDLPKGGHGGGPDPKTGAPGNGYPAWNAGSGKSELEPKISIRDWVDRALSEQLRR